MLNLVVHIVTTVLWRVNDAVRTSDCRASNDCTVGERFRMSLKRKQHWCNLVQTPHLPAETEDNHEKTKASRYPGWHLNNSPLKYDTKAPLTASHKYSILSVIFKGLWTTSAAHLPDSWPFHSRYYTYWALYNLFSYILLITKLLMFWYVLLVVTWQPGRHSSLLRPVLCGNFSVMQVLRVVGQQAVTYVLLKAICVTAGSLLTARSTAMMWYWCFAETRLFLLQGTSDRWLFRTDSYLLLQDGIKLSVFRYLNRRVIDAMKIDATAFFETSVRYLTNYTVLDRTG
jgi:hypothetical protein